MILAHGPYPCHPMVLTPALPTPLFTPMGHGYAGVEQGGGDLIGLTLLLLLSSRNSRLCSGD